MKKNYAATLSFLLLMGLTYYGFYTLKPDAPESGEVPLTQFSTARAFEHVNRIAEKPHAVGTAAHDEVKQYLISTLTEMGLEYQVQEDFAYKAGWGALSKAENIISRIPGDGSGQTLLLMSHYDSAPHSASHGASDAASGVAAILETIRAWREKGISPKNDIILLFTDAEELGLNGASIFVKKHPWAKEVDLALNFEARGSGGPSTMIVETNGGNAAMIKAFAEANTSHPYANSLMYSVYKLLPNDTDSTVLREFGDIDGFFFAFIGDHFDYHTAMDIPARLDPESLEHQGRYLTALLDYFSNADLNLKSDTDYVYFNFPLIKMVYYPFSWIFPMLILAWILFFVLCIYGVRSHQFSWSEVGRGFLPLLCALLGAYILGMGWSLITWFIPEYKDLLHGFPYNGYELIAAFVALILALTFYLYKLFHKPNQAASLSIAPLFFWLLISTAVAVYLPGASFFVIPVFFGIFCVFLLLKTGKPYLFWLCILCAPALFIISLYIKEFPVGLGLKMLPAALIFTVLLFGLLLPVMGFYKMKGKLALLFLLVSVGCFCFAFAKAGFTPERPFPNSLNYVYDVDKKEAYWATYNKYTDAWLKATLGEAAKPAAEVLDEMGSGKYSSNYTFVSEAPLKPVAPSSIYVAEDLITNGMREVAFTIYPQREVNDMILLNPAGTPFEYLEFNGEVVEKKVEEPYIFSRRKSDYLLSYRLSHRQPLQVRLKVADTVALKFTLFDYSYDLMENPDFNILSRPENTMPMPFVYTDAIVTRQEFNIVSKEPLKAEE